jgi:hypothetical protein
LAATALPVFPRAFGNADNAPGRQEVTIDELQRFFGSDAAPFTGGLTGTGDTAVFPLKIRIAPRASDATRLANRGITGPVSAVQTLEIPVAAWNAAIAERALMSAMVTRTGGTVDSYPVLYLLGTTKTIVNNVPQDADANATFRGLVAAVMPTIAGYTVEVSQVFGALSGGSALRDNAKVFAGTATKRDLWVTVTVKPAATTPGVGTAATRVRIPIEVNAAMTPAAKVFADLAPLILAAQAEVDKTTASPPTIHPQADASGLSPGDKWILPAAVTALEGAITVAGAVTSANFTAANYTTLETAIKAFTDAVQTVPEPTS